MRCRHLGLRKITINTTAIIMIKAIEIRLGISR